MKIKTTIDIRADHNINPSKKWVAVEDVKKWLTDVMILSERVSLFGAEYDNKMRSILRKTQREESTCLVAVYLREMIKQLEAEDE